MPDQTLLNSLTTVLIFVVGFSLLVSIILRNVWPHIGSVLGRKTIHIQFPLFKTVDFEIEKQNRPKRIILFFGKSSGLYSGNVIIKNGVAEVGRYELPKLPEYTGAVLGLFGKTVNRDLFRQSRTIIMSVQNYQPDHPLSLVFNLNENVQDAHLRDAYDLVGQDEISILVRGKQAVKDVT
jgi:hypothetical protein